MHVANFSTFLTLSQLADALQVSRATVTRWRAAGLPCAVDVGATVRVRLVDVIAWLGSKNEQKVSAPRKRGRPRNVRKIR